MNTTESCLLTKWTQNDISLCRLKIERENPLRKSGTKEVHNNRWYEITRYYKWPQQTDSNHKKQMHELLAAHDIPKLNQKDLENLNRLSKETDY